MKIARTVFLPFAAGYFLSYLFRTVNGPIADRLMEEFHLNAAGLGLLTSVYFLTFTLAQLPFGPLVDWYGPRRMQGVVLSIGALGAVVFAVAQNVPTLILGRALIGLGTSGALMAGLKALALWLPAERRALANGGFIMFGGLGAMASTLPMDWLMPVVGWRGVFLVLAAVTAVVVVLILTVVPESPAAVKPEDWRSNLRGLVDVYRDPAFWRLAPLSACVIGTVFAVHGLWAARWLRDVDLYAPGRVASDLLVMGMGLTLGAAAIGVATDRLRRCGVRPIVTFGVACTLFIALQVASIDRLGLPEWFVWGAIASFGGMTVLSYSILGEMFPAASIGRANGALNVLHLSMAFVLQYAMGVIASFWPADAGGHLPMAAYRAAFAMPLVLEVAALGWLVWSATRRRAEVVEGVRA
jgi:MFS family permease